MKTRKKTKKAAAFFILLVLTIAVGGYVAVTQAREYASLPVGKPTAGKPAASAGSTIPDGALTGSVIRINEIMPSNKSAMLDDKGQHPDWFELYNDLDQPIDLKGWGLSDSLKNPVQWTFPEVQIGAKGYLIVYCSGVTQSEKGKPLHANFRLSEGDTLILSNTEGKPVDAAEVPAAESNISYGRNADDASKWTQLAKSTPGFSNDDAGYAQYITGMQLPDEQKPSIAISEVMTQNSTTFKDGAGQYPDWVEITNAGKDSISLKGYGLSDNDNKPLKWQFPNISIKPGEQIAVLCSGDYPASTQADTKALRASFSLPSYNSAVVLSDPYGRTIDRVSIKELGSDMSYAKRNGQWNETARPTPGYPNNDAGYDQFLSANPPVKGSLEISQASNANASILATNGKYYDFIEIHNASGNAVNLKDYCLTDSTSNPAKWHFPDQTLAAGGYTTVFASGLNQAKAGQPLHANFGLSKTAELVALYGKDAKLIDKVPVENLRPNMSVGHKSGDAGYYYFTNPQVGAANANGAKEMLGMPSASVPSGRYTSTQKIALNAEDGAKICYTTDGSQPTELSTQYTGEITVKAQKQQAQEGSLPQGTVIRAIAIKNGCVPSPVMTASYFIDVPHTLPLVSISTTPKNLFDPVTGIYMEGPNASQEAGKFKEGANFYKNTEVPASFEVYDKDGKRVFNQDIALSMSGGLGLTKNQKTFAIHARSEYGSGTMDYPFFDNRTFTQYKTLVLRTNRDVTRIKESTLFNLTDGKIKALVQAYKPYVLYINGQYWGVYFMMEKRNKYMFAAHEGAQDPDSINIQKGTSIPIKGSNASYKQLMEYVKTHDMTQKASFDYVAARLDTDSFMDVMIQYIYTGNSDYYNMQSYQITSGGKWKQVFYDPEITFQLNHDTLAKRLGDTCNSDMFKGLLKYKPWKDAFIERFAWMMKEVYNPSRVDAAIDREAEAIRSEIGPMRIKFGDTATVNNWNAAVQQMHVFAKQRPAIMVNQIKSLLSPTQAQRQMLDEAVK